MAKVVIIIEDKDGGDVDVQFTSDTPIPEDFNEITTAQILAGQLHDLIGRIFSANEHAAE